MGGVGGDWNNMREKWQFFHTIPVPAWRHHHSSWSLWLRADKKMEQSRFTTQITKFTIFLIILFVLLSPLLPPPSSLPCTNLHRPIAVLRVQVPLGQTPSVCTFRLEVRERMSWGIQAQRILSTVWYCPHKYDALNAHCFGNGDLRTEMFQPLIWSPLWAMYTVKTFGLL